MNHQQKENTMEDGKSMTKERIAELRRQAQPGWLMQAHAMIELLDALESTHAALSAARVAGEGQALVDESELVALRCINDAVHVVGDQASETRNVNWAVVRDAKQRLRITQGAT